MDFLPIKLKNMEMPARHIASHSFDEILSDLGDDPANPDPYGIRKSPQQNKGPSKPQNPTSENRGVHSSSRDYRPMDSRRFIANDAALNKNAHAALEDSQKLLSEFKRS